MMRFFVRSVLTPKAGLKEGQIIAFGTDGIWKACNRSGKMFGKERFRDII
jgi:sigma-B regulation protein RsbU (phosphoserine phosphatase)